MNGGDPSGLPPAPPLSFILSLFFDNGEQGSEDESGFFYMVFSSFTPCCLGFQHLQKEIRALRSK
jgi:hypothetical protein